MEGEDLEDKAAQIEKKEALSYFVELFLIIRIIQSEFPGMRHNEREIKFIRLGNTVRTAG